MYKPLHKDKTDKTEKKEREKGFNVYLGGANVERVDTQLRREKAQKFRIKPASLERKNWNSNPSIQSIKPIIEERKSISPQEEYSKWPVPSFSYPTVQEEENIVDVLESLDKSSINILKESIRNFNSSKKEANLDGSPIPEDFYNNEELEEELIQNDDDEEEDEIPEIIEDIPRVESKKEEIITSKGKVNVVKARPISANIKFEREKPIEVKPFNNEPKLVKKHPPVSAHPFRKNNESSAIQNNPPPTPQLQHSESRPKNLEDLLKKIESLDESKRNELENFLEKIVEGQPNQKFKFKAPQIVVNKEIKNMFEVKEKKKENNKEKKIVLRNNKQMLQIRVVSTWGNIHVVGFTELQLYDKEGQKILLKPADFQIINSNFTNHKNLANLLNGVYKTIDEKNMWFSNMPAPPDCLEMIIEIERNINLGFLLLWNYNKSLIESVKGIKEAEILLEDKLIWSGIVKRGVANEYDDYCEVIPLDQSLPIEKINNILNKNEPEIKEKNPPKQKNQPEIKDKDPPKSKKELDINDKDPLKPSYLTKSISPSQRPSSKKSHPKTYNIFDESGPGFASKSVKLNDEKLVELFVPDKKMSPALPLEILSKKKEELKEFKKNEEYKKKPDLIRNIPFPKEEEEKISNMKKGSIFLKRKTGNDDPDDETGTENSLQNLEFFNLTQTGRLKVKERDRIFHEEVKILKKDVEDTVQSIYQKLDFKPMKHREFDALDLFFQTESNKKHPTPKNAAKEIKEIRDLKEPKEQKDIRDIKEIKEAKEFKEIREIKDIKEIKELKEQDPLQPLKKHEPAKISSIQKTGIIPLPSNVPVDTYSDLKKKENEFYEIPIAPRGRKLNINIKSTWGDNFYVGLTGIEFFNEKGNKIKISAFHIKANPPDINVLPEYGKDPRTIDKIVDEVYCTCDDLHMWLAPFTKNEENKIFIDFGTEINLSMIRVWNYNKSRIHSFRGAREISITLDENIIFKGEVKQANGSLKNIHEFCEYIMFTNDENVIKMIENNDWLNDYTIPEDDLVNEDVNRPNTANKKQKNEENKENFNIINLGQEERPMTSVRAFDNFTSFKKKELAPGLSKEIKNMSILVINILDNWGDPYYAGLVGLELYDINNKKIKISIENLNSKPRDLKTALSLEDHRILENLINDNNLTTNDKNMWLIPFTKGEKHFIKIKIPSDVELRGIKFWNYNKSSDDLCRGLKTISIVYNENYLTSKNGIILKKASAVDFFDYGQFFKLPFADGWEDERSKIPLLLKDPSFRNGSKYLQEYDVIQLPMGFTLKIVILSTWGDPHYVGMNGIEIFDHANKEIISNKENSFCFGAEPFSANVLKNIKDDKRTIDKLFNGVNNTYNDNNMWLTPFLITNNEKDAKYTVKNNTILVSFDKPIIISSMNLWNYSKNSNRGAKEIEIHLDELLLYKGYLRKANEKSEFKDKSGSTTILFSKNKDHVEVNKGNIYSEDSLQQSVLFYNENKLMNKENEDNKIINAEFGLNRPPTSVVGV